MESRRISSLCYAGIGGKRCDESGNIPCRLFFILRAWSHEYIFMKLEDLKNDEATHYVKTWILAMRDILNWPESRTLEWSERWLCDLNDPDSMFYNRTPTYYLLPAIIPARLIKRLPSDQLPVLRQDILKTIEQGDTFCDRKPDFDWNLARQRIEALLAEYGESLP